MKPDNIFLRFFAFNLLLSVFFIFSQKLFENNFFIAYPFLWIILMTAIPLGAAIYSRCSTRIDGVLSDLFPAGLLYFMAAMTVCMNTYVFSWGTTGTMPINHLLWQNFIQFIWEIAISGPLWVIVGMLELNLYQALSQREEKVQWLSYLSGVAGLLSGMLIVFYLLPVPAPFWLAGLILLFFLLYHVVSSMRFTWKTALILLLLFPFFLTNSYVQSPERTYQKYAKFLSLSAKDTLRTVKDTWRREVHFTLAERPSNNWLFGFYNNIFHWTVHGSNNAVDAATGHLIPEGAVIAVLGAGGGSQMKALLPAHPDKIYAVDIIPGLFADLAEAGVASFENSLIKTVTKDARKFIDQSNEKFDLIFLPATETPMQLSKSLFEPYNALFTREAFSIYRKKLKPGGLIVITKPLFLFRLACLNNYIATLKAARFRTGFYFNRYFALIIGSLDEDTLDRAVAVLGRNNPPIVVVHGPQGGKIIVDDKPFYVSGILYSPGEKKTFALLLALSIFVLAGIVFIMLKYFSRGSGTLLLPPILCGINYTLLLLTFQLLLFFQISNPLEAAVVGNVIFIGLALLGGVLYKRRIALGLTVIACVIGARVFHLNYASAVLTGVVIISGGFFPRLLHYFRERLTFLLVLDGLGAAIAGGIYLVVPTLLGIRLLFSLALVIFAATLLSIVWIIDDKKRK